MLLTDLTLKTPRRCGTCDHWRRDIIQKTAEGVDVGECRRFPPQMQTSQGEVVSLWPYSSAEDFCGEWRLRVDA